MTTKACMGAPTRSVRTIEYMEECEFCGLRVRDDMVDNSFFGFAASCLEGLYEERERAAPGKDEHITGEKK